jgi:2-polyprenyl-6-hydroxyphenyl methylase/3-demethylubiquinone-9 3-methyltransferase
MSVPTSIDPKSVEYYHKLADTWWDAKGPFWPLHTLNALRIEWIMSQLENSSVLHGRQGLEGIRVLDIGCGGGILSETLAKKGAQVTAIDVVEKNITIATHHAQQQGLDIDYQCITVEEMAQQKQEFDIVFNMEVVEHVADLDVFMRASNQLVKPGGYQFLATINRNLLAGFIAIIGAEYVLQWLPKGTHQFNKLVKPNELRHHLLRDQFKEITSTGVKVNPFQKSMSFYSKLWINYMLMAEKVA